MSKSDRYQRIKNWLIGYGKFVVNEREDNNFHFSFYIWSKNSKKQIIPLLIGFPKPIYNGNECLLLGIGWTLDKKSEVVNAVLDEPERRMRFVTSLKRVINPNTYSLKFKPIEGKIDTIKISRLLPIDWLDSNSLFREIINLWMQYAKYLNQMQKASPYDLARPSDYK